ncbi:ciliaflagella57-likeassociated and flagella-associated 57-like [Octopus vulgaris]|uniref:Ciliaflagella57-likeassociated and flagella-associated 57-like n=1 Tax=Octopus vulgaris TaxID=6645 RepID=A0AA36BRP3_OCTVU|nr:ciliaflagella57-likeassociated and flagella-associated 57-like [Octopus vulgaris]
MVIATASVKHIFGLNSDVAGNLCYQDEQKVLYTCGSFYVVYNIDQKSQKCIVASETGLGISSFVISSNRRYIAIAEVGDDKGPILSIHDIHANRKRKTLMATSSDQIVQATEYKSLAFSPDSKYLAAHTGGPDWVLQYWAWEKSKLLTFIRTVNPQSKPIIYQVCFNPQDNTHIGVIGNGVLRSFRYSEGNLKPFNFPKIESQNFTCFTWISDERLLVGTDKGKVLVIESGESKAEFNPLTDAFLESRSKDSQSKELVRYITKDEFKDQSTEVSAIVAYSKGFACACGVGTVHLFERSEEKELYKKTREVLIPVDNSVTLPNSSTYKQIITCMTISPSEETLVVSSNTNQIYSIALSSTDLRPGGQRLLNFELLAQSFHSNVVTGLDICARKPIVVTSSLDRSIRIWNFETCSQELFKEFSEEICSVALHPSGLYILVGFTDKLKLMNILIDEIKQFQEFPCKNCRECAFSNGGHLFAAVNGNVVQIYSTVTFELIINLKGHNKLVNSVVWSPDDSKLVSCGGDGAVYEWEPLTGKRVGENILKTCVYSTVTISPDGKTVYAVGNDNKLKEISDSQVFHQVEAGDVTLTSVSLSHTGRMLFAGTSNGCLWSLKFPLGSSGEWQEYKGHRSKITRMRVTFDDQYLVSVSEDSTVMVWQIQDKDSRGIKRDKDSLRCVYADEILITKSDLEEKNAIMSELRTRVNELGMENEYQLRLKDMNYNEKIKELTDKFIQEMESLKTKNQVLKTERDKQEAKHEEQLTGIMQKHAKELQDLESANNQKLMLEYEKYQELQTKLMKMQEENEHRLQEMDESKKNALNEMEEKFESKRLEMVSKLHQSQEENRRRQKEEELTRKMMEEDADIEILNIKTDLERELRREKDSNVKLKSESGILKQKFSTLQKDIDEHKEASRKYQDEINKLNTVIRNLEKDILGLKKEILERDETIQDKEKRIYDLKKKNQELEKFKFVLDYKIKELKKQIEPREDEIKRMCSQIQEMESELEQSRKSNISLELKITDLKQKHNATSKALYQKGQLVKDTEALVMRFKTDLHRCVIYIQEPKCLKESIKCLYRKYVQDDITETVSVDADIQKEEHRQREHLNHTVTSLKRKLVTDSRIHRKENVKIMQENVHLIKDINDLQLELKSCRTNIHDLEAALGMHSKSFKRSASMNDWRKDPVELLAAMANKSPSAIQHSELMESKRMLEIQRDEIKRLRQELETRPQSSGTPKLPPVLKANDEDEAVIKSDSPLGHNN